MLAFLTLITPISTYFDIRYIEENSEWRPATTLWILAMIVWLISGIPGAYYLHRRRKKYGKPNGLVTYSLLAIALLIAAEFLVLS